MGTLSDVGRVMPDIAREARAQIAGRLDWVGMGRIEVPVTIGDGNGRALSAPARVDAYVDLITPQARGIHMSRLYLLVDRAMESGPLTPAILRSLLREFLQSHSELSQRAMLRVAFDFMLRRRALVSEHSGWKSYPVAITGVLEGEQLQLEVAVEVGYSSTCPCSAALARQIVQEKFSSDFAPRQVLDYQRVLAWLGSEQGIVATPHSQRSAASVRVRLDPARDDFALLAVIDALESALKTPLQAAVKREDEQAFARLNGANLMFCEDAARRIQAVLDADPAVLDFWARATHFESLHPHDAVAITTKGIVGGYDGRM